MALFRLPAVITSLILVLCDASPSGANYEINHLHTFQNPSVLPDSDRDNFGVGLDMRGETYFIGARVADNGAVDTGALYHFENPTSVPIQTITNPTPDPDDRFGTTVVIVGNTVWVSATLDDTVGNDAGIVYIFDIGSGNLLDTLTSPNPTAGGHFGTPMILSGSDVLIGSTGDSIEGIPAGAVYRVDGETGTIFQTYTNPSPATGDFFGAGIDSLDCQVLISARFDVDDGTGEGTAYLFNTDGNLLQTFPNPSPGLNESYASVALFWDKVAVGAGDNDDKGADSGVVRIFDKITGGLLRSVYHPDETAGARFGGLARIGSDLFIGAPASSGVLEPGRAFVISPETGDFLGEFVNPISEIRDFFGGPVAFDGERVLIAGWGESPTGILSGAAYLYSATTDEVFIPSNLPPSAPVVSISPAEPDTLDDLSCVIDVESVDPEWCPVTYSYDWYRNGALVVGATDSVIPSSDTAWGDFFQCVVTPNDGEIDGASGETAVAIIGNSAARPLAVENWVLYDRSPAR
jgi:hypothetical protein